MDQLEQTRSSREAYLAVWKASPYFLISVTGLTLTSLAYNWIFAAIGVFAALIISNVTIICWFMTGRRDVQISRLGGTINELEKTVNDRVEFSRAAFVSYLPRLNRLPSSPSDIRFSDRPDLPVRFNFDSGLVQQRVLDMICLHESLVEEMRTGDALYNEFEFCRSNASVKLSEFLDGPDIAEMRKFLKSLPGPLNPIEQRMSNVLGMPNESLKQCIFREIAARSDPLAFAYTIKPRGVEDELLSFMTGHEFQDNPFSNLIFDTEIRRFVDDVVISFLKYQPVRLRVEETVRYRFGKDKGLETSLFPIEPIRASSSW